MRTVLANAIWNVVNGTSSALVAILVPPFLTRLLAPEAYGAWALALQIGTYVGLFGFGIQVAVGRYVAYHEARGDTAARDGIVATSFWFLAAVAVPAWLGICVLAVFIERLLPSLSPALVPQTQAAIVLVGLSLAINLPASVFAAVFTGRQRSDIPAKIQGTGRIALAAGIVLAGLSRDLGVIAGVYALISAATIAALWYAWRHRTAAPTLARRHVGRAHGRELFGFCLSLTLWSLSMLLLSGLDLLIVGRWDYAATPYFAIGVTLMTLLSGTMSSLANALVPATASLVDDTGRELRKLMVRSTRLIDGFAILSGSVLVFAGDVLLTWWLSPVYAAQAWPILSLLVTAIVLRNALVPYVTVAIGLGYQRRIILTPLIEGAVSICGSLLLVRGYGAQGVAAAKIAAGVVGVALLIAQHPLRTPLGGMPRSALIAGCIGRPFMALSVIVPAGLLAQNFSGGILKLAIVGMVSAVSVWWLTLSAEDRDFAATILRARLGRTTATGAAS